MDKEPDRPDSSRRPTRIARAAVIVLTAGIVGVLLLVATCSEQSQPAEEAVSASNGLPKQAADKKIEQQQGREEQLNEGLYLVKNGRDVGKGPVSAMYTTVGGVRLGDTQEQVLALLGEPSERSQARSTPYPLWHYMDQDLYIMFYRNGENESAGGVISVRLGGRSTLKLNDRRSAPSIAIGDGLDRVLELYRPIGGTPDEGAVRNFWVRGEDRAQTGLYKPSVHVLMKEGRITSISLENEDEDPGLSPLAGTVNGKIPRAAAKSEYGELYVIPDTTEKIDLLGAPSCMGRENDYRFEGAYRAYFQTSDGTATSLSATPIPVLIYPSLEQISISKLQFGTFEAFYFIPEYADCHGLTFYLYGANEEGAFPFRFELENGAASDTFYVLPSDKPRMEDGMLVTYGGGGAGTDGYLKYTFKPDLANKTMILLRKEQIAQKPALE
jgi:hypothetical protein